MAAALVVQVLRGEVEEHISTVDVIIERVLTYHGVIDFPVVSDFRKGGSGGKALDHDQLLQPPGQGVVLTNLEVPAFVLEKVPIFPLRHLRAVNLNKLIFGGLLDTEAPVDFIVDGPLTFAQSAGNGGLGKSFFEHPLQGQALVPGEMLGVLVVHAAPPEIRKAGRFRPAPICRLCRRVLLQQLDRFLIRQDVPQLAVKGKTEFQERGQLGSVEVLGSLLIILEHPHIEPGGAGQLGLGEPGGQAGVLQFAVFLGVHRAHLRCAYNIHLLV